MIPQGKCPKCGKTVNRVLIDEVKGYIGIKAAWICNSYLCPSCKTVLSVQIDPIAIKTDTVKEIKAVGVDDESRSAMLVGP